MSPVATAAAHRDDWRSDAACLSADPDLFFPVSSSGPSLEQVAKAKAICAVCQVRQECPRLALAAHEVRGVRGGTGPTRRAGCSSGPSRGATTTGGCSPGNTTLTAGSSPATSRKSSHTWHWSTRRYGSHASGRCGPVMAALPAITPRPGTHPGMAAPGGGAPASSRRHPPTWRWSPPAPATHARIQDG